MTNSEMLEIGQGTNLGDIIKSRTKARKQKQSRRGGVSGKGGGGLRLGSLQQARLPSLCSCAD